ncbi:energy transducer TonB [Pseudomonas sp. R5(2019)]|uniref:energy transducer TonB n=1 Tax=Pseudomonas sp. R5(2019) TaxID=2697566 RepID=UPI00141289B7|nr:energy transducer TonB [Pseudomonas sp. R5(2019)]NBA94517.1 energy transducer TonB [Pseudomonas sp. R5(2019)]
MIDITSLSPGYLSPVDSYSAQNIQTLGGVSQLWQDFFARALAEQQGDVQFPALASEVDASSGEPITGSEVLAQIISQRLCAVKDTDLNPPEPLFLPIAEFELDLLDKPAPPFPIDELIAQQKNLEFDISWRRPIVMSFGEPIPEPGPAPQSRPLRLPIAEFEADLLDNAAEPYDEATLDQQQRHLDFDTRWVSPVVLQNVRLAA